MRSLYDSTGEFYGAAGVELDKRATKALEPLVKEFLERGYPVREMQSLLFLTVLDVTLEHLIGKQSALKGEGPDGYGRSET